MLNSKNRWRLLAFAEVAAALICLALETYGLAALFGLGAVVSLMRGTSRRREESSLWGQSLLVVIALCGAFAAALGLAAAGVVDLNAVQLVMAVLGLVAAVLGLRRVLVSRPARP